MKNDNIPTLNTVIDTLKLSRHPEGGYYARTYAAEDKIEVESGIFRPAMTSIYYCLPVGEYSAFHRLTRSTEKWFYHTGCRLTVYLLQDGVIHKQVLDPSSASYVVSIPVNTWFAARPEPESEEDSYSLVSCAVTPGFAFEDFELAGSDLIEQVHEEYHPLVQSMLVR